MQGKGKKILRGVIWSLLDTFSNFALKFFFALAITRILTPRDYGLIAYTGIFMGIAGWISEGGFGNALIQKKQPDETDYATGYFFNVAISVFFFVLYFFSAPFIAEYFGEEELRLILRVVSVALVIDSLSYIHLIRLIKEIKFKEQALLNFLVSVISGSLALYLAIRGFGYWSLVVQLLTGSALRMAGLWFIVKWRPKLRFSWLSFREQFGFGSKIFVQGLLDRVFRELNALVIGKSYHTSALGNYSRGNKFYELFIIQTGLAVNKVFYPVMAKEQEQKDVHKSIYGRIYNLLFFVMGPLSMIFFLLADPLIRVLLTEKWVAAIPYMKLFFLAGFVSVLISFNSNTVLSSNRPGLCLRMDAMYKGLMGLALVFTFRISIQAILIGWLSVSYFYYFFYERLMYNLSYYEKGKYSKMSQVLVCLLPMVGVYMLSTYLLTSPFWILLCNLIFQPVVYLIGMRLSGFTIYGEFREVVKHIIPRKLQSVL